MSKSLVIVESPTKAKTIHKYLGKDFVVHASVGHIKDLPQSRLAVDIENNFTPHYIKIRGKGDVIKSLQKAANNAKEVFIATDPDREGEAIAMHIAEEIRAKNNNIKRVLFEEITEKGIKTAMKNPREIDEKLVSSQQARRVMDRLVGYQVSPFLWKTVYRGLSAGRVQSVAMRLICEREEIIKNFVPEEYWTIQVELQGKKTEPFRSKLIKIGNKKPDIPTKADAEEHVRKIKSEKFVVLSIDKKDVKRYPSPPFTTSTLQQEASRKLGMSARKTMMVAQHLYEGIELGEKGIAGLITYMRTDSNRLSEEAVSNVRGYIASSYGIDYLPPEPIRYKDKASAQGAHEAIRPTLINLPPREIKKFLTKEQFQLYELIWNRFVACQMAPAIFEQTTIDIKAGDYLFRTTGQISKFRGFLQAYEESKEETDTEEENGEMKIPVGLNAGEEVNLLGVLPDQHFTKPPGRYTESSLVKELDSLGIGRPSTYASIIGTIVARKYVERQSRTLFPTELGMMISRIVVKYFPDIFNVNFTAKMEDELDKIEEGKIDYLQVMNDFYSPFSETLKKAEGHVQTIKDALQESTGITCDVCGREMIIKWGRNGRFYACTGYPDDCKNTKPIEPELQQPVDEKCEKCGSQMVIKVGRFGKFMACSNYPTCKNTKPLSIGVNCPKDNYGGYIVERRSKRGRSFYGCSRYPDCDFVSWDKPVNKKCENCGNAYLVEKYSQAKGNYLKCPNCKTDFTEEGEGITEVEELAMTGSE